MNELVSALPRRIAHLDMDAFFAAVELLRYPQLKGFPVVIGGGRNALDDALAAQGRGRCDAIPVEAFARLKSYVGRGVITTATYPARAFGVGSAMGLMKAARLCPEAILLPVSFELYRDYSRRFKAVIAGLAPVIENRGIDEVFIDFTHVPDGQHEGGRTLARQIQKEIFAATQLTCSVGVAPNKLLAKMASEFNKPNGISIVQAEDVKTLFWPLPCRKMSGIGPKTEARLARYGIHTLGELAAQNRFWLSERFGKSYGAWLHDAAWGRDDSPMVMHSEPLSMSRETTFARDLHAVHDKAELGAIFTRLCEQVAVDLGQKAYTGKTIGIKLRYADFKIVTRDQTIAQPTADARELRHVAGQCLKRVDLTQRFRLLGVRVGNLVPAASAQTEAASAAARKAREETALALFGEG